MLSTAFETYLASEIRSLREAGLYKSERVLTSPQKAEISVQGRTEPVLNFCANNYLGLANHPAHRRRRARRRSTATASAWPRCASSAARRTIHKAARGAAGALPGHRGRDPLFAPASMPMAGCSRRCSARRTRSSAMRSTTPASSTASASARRSGLRYANNDMTDLEARLKEAAGLPRSG